MRLFTISRLPPQEEDGDTNSAKSKTAVIKIIEVFGKSENSEQGSQTDCERQQQGPPRSPKGRKFGARFTITESVTMLFCIGVIIAVLIYAGKVTGQPSGITNGDDKQYDDAKNPNDYTQYVNIWLGTQGGGNDNPAVTRPFGMVKLGPDLYASGEDAYSGYLSNGVFSGFSMMHEQGTGGAPKYGVVSQLPLVGDVAAQPLSNLTVGRHSRMADGGSIGYYKAVTSEDVVVELAATSRAGMYQYTFPRNIKKNGNVLVDVSHVLPSFRRQGLSQGYAGGHIEVAEDGHYEGYGVYNNGWNRSPDWTIYFCKHPLFSLSFFVALS